MDYELRWRAPIEGLTVGLVGNLNKSEFDRVAPAVQRALPLFTPGSRLVNSIQENYRADVGYNHGVGSGWEAFGNLSYGRTGNRLQSSGLYAQSYGLVNATLGVRRNQYELALIGDNLADERGPTFIGTTGPNSGQGPDAADGDDALPRGLPVTPRRQNSLKPSFVACSLGKCMPVSQPGS